MDINIEIHLPFPPTENNYYVKTKNGVFISKQGRQYREKAIEYIREQIPTKLKLEDRLMCICILYPPDRRTRDVDNYDKALIDSITHSGLWLDDSQSDQLFIFRGEIIKHGKVVLFIRDAGPIIPVNNPHLINSIIR